MRSFPLDASVQLWGSEMIISFLTSKETASEDLRRKLRPIAAKAGAVGALGAALSGFPDRDDIGLACCDALTSIAHDFKLRAEIGRIPSTLHALVRAIGRADVELVKNACVLVHNLAYLDEEEDTADLSIPHREICEGLLEALRSPSVGSDSGVRFEALDALHRVLAHHSRGDAAGALYDTSLGCGLAAGVAKELVATLKGPQAAESACLCRAACASIIHLAKYCAPSQRHILSDGGLAAVEGVLRAHVADEDVAMYAAAVLQVLVRSRAAGCGIESSADPAAVVKAAGGAAGAAGLVVLMQGIAETFPECAETASIFVERIDGALDAVAATAATGDDGGAGAMADEGSSAAAAAASGGGSGRPRRRG